MLKTSCGTCEQATRYCSKDSRRSRENEELTLIRLSGSSKTSSYAGRASMSDNNTVVSKESRSKAAAYVG